MSPDLPPVSKHQHESTYHLLHITSKYDCGIVDYGCHISRYFTVGDTPSREGRKHLVNRVATPSRNCKR
ncbi:hypothetical protein J6590_004559 [Homalodisca vitripennis]|nr:hypothetical protein J6590_004559 [Homalodisca vitripennis]